MKLNVQSFIIFIVLLATQYNCFAQWTSNTAVNTPVTTATNIQREFRLQGDGKRGVFLVWKDYRNGVSDIFVHHLNSAGIITWTLNGIGACTDPSDQSTPEIVSDMNGGVIIGYSDWRSGVERDVYVQRIDSNGNMLWTPNGNIAAGKTLREHNEKMISDGAGGTILVWEEQESWSNWNVRAQRISSSGLPLWQSGGILVTTAGGSRINARLKEDGHGGAIVTWQDYRNGIDYDIYTQRINSAGVLLWGAAAVPICTATNSQNNPKIESDETNGGAYISWLDKRNGADLNIYMQRVDSMGTPLWVNNGASVVQAAGDQSALDFASSTRYTGVVITWKDERSGVYNIYAQRIAPDGLPLWANNGIPISSSAAEQKNPNIAEDKLGNVIIAWQDKITGDYNIKAQRIDTNGVALWNAGGVNVSTASGSQTGVKHIADSTGGAIFVWDDKRTDAGDIYAHHLFGNGTTNGIKEQISYENISCFPNPLSEGTTLHFQTTVTSEISIRVYNNMGKELQSTTKIYYPGTYDEPIDMHMYADGVYHLTVSDDIKCRTFKLIKIH